MSDVKPRTYLTPQEAAERLRLSRRHVYRLISLQEITTLRTGRKILVPLSSIRIFLANKTSWMSNIDSWKVK